MDVHARASIRDINTKIALNNLKVRDQTHAEALINQTVEQNISSNIIADTVSTPKVDEKIVDEHSSMPEKISDIINVLHVAQETNILKTQGLTLGSGAPSNNEQGNGYNLEQLEKRLNVDPRWHSVLVRVQGNYENLNGLLDAVDKMNKNSMAVTNVSLDQNNVKIAGQILNYEGNTK